MANLQTYLLKIISLHFLLTFFKVNCQKSSDFTLKLNPWDSPNSPFYHPNLTQAHKIHKMVMSSKARATLPTLQNQTIYTNALQIPIRNDDSRYSVNIEIGIPPKRVTLLLDTGSGPIWTQCSSPVNSRTYKALSCRHPACRNNDKICKCVNEQCVCSLTQGRGMNHVQVVLSSDSFTLPMKNNQHKTFNDIIFGCSNQPLTGTLGMNKMPISLISQVRNSVQGRYSYCLHEGGGYLRFGDDIPQIGIESPSTRILSSNVGTLSLDLKDISVAKKRLGLSKGLFSSNKYSLVIDTGSPYTVLMKKAYDKVIQEIENYYKSKLERVSGNKYKLELCYRYHPRMMDYASMTFHLKGADYVTGHLYIFPENGITCVALIPGDVSILGAFQQWNKRFVFDINANMLKFEDEDCSKDVPHH